jgi:DNA-binding transcriptional ArsR family regulator
VVRLAFTSGDLAATRFGVSALHHAVYAALCVHQPRLAPAGTLWRDVRRAVPSGSMPMIDLLTSSGVRASVVGELFRFEVPMVHTGRPSLGDELDALTALDQNLEDPVRRFNGSLWRLMRPCAARDLLLDRPQLMRVLADGLHVLFHRFLQPEWAVIQRAMDADIGRRADLGSRAGMGTVLASLSPRLSWTEGGLEISGLSARDLSFGGRGLLLSPIASAESGFLSLVHSPDERRPLLCYPVPTALPPPGPAAGIDSLAALVGKARARTLRAIESGCSTTELARRLRSSPSTASEHIRTLREAGLVATHRDGRSVRHVLSTLGRNLLSSNA